MQENNESGETKVVTVQNVRTVTMAEMDAEIEYKIAKKKETLLQKLRNLRDNKKSDEESKVTVDQVTDLLDDFEQQYKDAMAKELEEYRNEQERIRKEYERKRREEEDRRLAAERLKASKTPTYLTAVEDDIETSTKQEEYVEVKAQEIQAVVVYEP